MVVEKFSILSGGYFWATCYMSVYRNSLLLPIQWYFATLAYLIQHNTYLYTKRPFTPS